MKFSSEVRSVEERAVGGIRQMLMICALTVLTACGGGGGGGGGNNSVTVPPPVSTPTGANVVTLRVSGGPSGNINLPLITVQVCETTTPNPNCVTLNNVIVDTGSSGLRVVRSALGSLALQNSVSGSPLYECVRFADNTQAWGPVQIADVKIGGKTAGATRIQVLGDTQGFPEPSACGSSGENLDNVAALGADAILGVGYFTYDCGGFCSGASNNQYFTCTLASCTSASAPLQNQVENPVAKFSGDNNGVIIQLPSVAPAGVASVEGSLIFGIDTQSNNALGSATVFTADPIGHLNTTYHSVNYPRSFIDSGSNGLYFPNTDPATLPICVGRLTDFYCPLSTRNLSATLIGANSVSSAIAFSVVNAQSLSSNIHVASTLAGVFPSGFDWGLPFFFGRRVYTAFETKLGGPYTAF
jgi:hypothetical protein